MKETEYSKENIKQPVTAGLKNNPVWIIQNWEKV